MKREFIVYVNVNGDEYLDVIKINCKSLDVIDNRTLTADETIITFKEDMYGISLEGEAIWINY